MKTRTILLYLSILSCIFSAFYTPNLASRNIWDSLKDKSPWTCRDGWRSPSIGKQGACSWHNGVKPRNDGLADLLSSSIWIILTISYISSSIFLIRIALPEKKSLDSTKREKQPAPQPLGPFKPLAYAERSPPCPLCGARMLAKHGTKGFYAVCEKKSCLGTRNSL